MDGIPTPADVERELGELRARAYGPGSDIRDDPAALARLTELEAARADAIRSAAKVDEPVIADDPSPDERAEDDAVEAPPPPTDPEPPTTSREEPAESRWQRLTRSRSARFWLAAGAGAAVVAAVYGVTWLFGSHPDATMWRTSSEADDQVQTLIFEEVGDIDMSTLESYDSFQGVEPWSAVDFEGNPCLILIERSTDTALAECTPSEGDLTADIGAWPVMDYDITEDLPDGSIIRFHHRGNSVDAYVHRAPSGE